MADQRLDIGRWTAAALLIAVVIGFYWKLVLTNQFTWLTHADAGSLILPWFQFQAGEVHKGRFPLWDPNVWGGQPLLAQAQPGAAYPPNWILYALPLGNGWIKQKWLHWYLVTAHLLAAWFAYLFARELGARRLASVLGGAVFSLGAWIGQNEWPYMLNGGIWAPLVFLYMLRVTRGQTAWISSGPAGFFLGVAWLSGHINVPIYILLAALAWWAWLIARNWKLAGPFVLFCGMLFCAAALQVLPGLEYGRLAMRWAGAPEPLGWADRVPYDVHSHYSSKPGDVLGALFPALFLHSNPFVGVTALALAIAAMGWLWSRNEVKILVAIGLGALLYALGPHDMMQGLFYSIVPMVEKARSPSMAVMLFGMSAAMLAALGLEAVLGHIASTRRVAKTLLWLGAGIVMFRLVQVMASKPQEIAEQRSMITALAALLFGVLLLAWKHNGIGQRGFCCCVLGLFLLEGGNSNTFEMASVTEENRMAWLKELGRHGDIAEFVRKWPGQPRVMVDSNVVRYNFGDWYGLNQYGGYLASVTENMYRHDFLHPAVKRLMGVELLVAREPSEFHSDLVFRGPSGLNVYRNSGVLPRTFTVHEAERITDRKLVAMYMDRLGAEAVGRKTLLLEVPPPLEKCGGPDRVWVKRYTSSEVVIGADMGCRGMAILSDVYYPGWQAEVDGRSAKIWEAYALVRGVVLEEGMHEIVFRYRPRSVALGAALSALAAVVAAVLWFQGRRVPPAHQASG